MAINIISHWLMNNRVHTIIFLSIFFFSCSRDNSTTPVITPAYVSNVVTSGNWRVTLYVDSGQDETSHFSGYNFVFASGGSVVATKNGTSVSGTWSTLLDDSQTKLVLNFATPADFIEISDDWHVIEQTANLIRLEDVSGGNGGVDYLTFEKN